MDKREAADIVSTLEKLNKIHREIIEEDDMRRLEVIEAKIMGEI